MPKFNQAPAQAATAPIVSIQQLTTKFGDQVIHQDLNLHIQQGERLALVGGSGAGKSVLLSQIALLTTPALGSVSLFGQPTDCLTLEELLAVRKKMGVMFQQGALFTSLTVLENIMLPLREHQPLPEKFLQELAMLKIKLTGLPASAATKLPQELSGGMLKRAAVARALALDPKLLLLDEPTAGLDPASASAFDDLLLELHASMDLTLILVTHDLDSLWKVSDQVAFLGAKKLLYKGSMVDLMQQEQPLIQHYFANARAQGAYLRSTAATGNALAAKSLSTGITQ